MSVLENPELEEQLKGMNVLNELYLRGAFDEKTAIKMKEYGEKVVGILFCIDNGLVVKGERTNSIYIHIDDDMNTTHPMPIFNLFLSPKGKQIVEETLRMFKSLI